MDKTEARYGEIAREMVATGNWITPQLEPGEPFWAKPPLSIWLTAFSFEILGINEFSARLPSTILSVLTCLLVFYLGKTIRDSIFGLKAVLILSTIGLFYVLSATVMTDLALNASITLSMVAFITALREENSFRRRFWGYLFFVGLGLGVLSKGPLSCVLVFIPICIWTVWQKQFKKVLTSLPWITGTMVALAIAVPWHILAEKKTPGFLEYYIIGEHFKRFTVSHWRGDLYGSAHEQPKGMIWLFIIAGTMPWTIVAGCLAIRLKKLGIKLKQILQNSWYVFLLLWFLSPLVFFTLASNITAYYCLPSLPAFALLLIIGMDAVWKLNYPEKLPWCLRERNLLIITAFTPIFVLIMSFTLMPRIGRQQSQLNIVELFQKYSVDDKDAVLLYVQGMPQSADFYAKGRAIDVSKEEFETTKERFFDKHKDFYVVKIDHLDNVNGYIKEHTKEVGRFGEYTLRREL
ncbi:MAG: glycosyltransferase family 39 protein [Candidatus Omnitrophica bacterium]|nr:glycosyltransferase family 39 protein [Candidatus Omnitrophota bacterium]